MNKYIRTARGVYKIKDLILRHDPQLGNYYENRYGLALKPLKEGNSIKDLCDCYVCVRSPAPPAMFSYFEDLLTWVKAEGYKPHSCFGGIWTDMGLTYVAELTKSNKLELL